MKNKDQAAVTPAAPQEEVTANEPLSQPKPENYLQRSVRFTKESGITASDEYKGDNREEIIYLGLVSEIGEVADLLKKMKEQGYSYDPKRMREEIGDFLWYVARVFDGSYAGIRPRPVHEPTWRCIALANHYVMGLYPGSGRTAAARQSEVEGALGAILSIYGQLEIAAGTRTDWTEEQFLADFVLIMDENQAKLASRYSSGKFSHEESVNRTS